MNTYPLTAQLLGRYPYGARASAAIRQRGRAYYQDGRVVDVELLNASTAICQVLGDSGDYQVQIEAKSSPNDLTFRCECPYAGDGNFCKHMIAAALELTDFLDDEDDDDDVDDGMELDT